MGAPASYSPFIADQNDVPQWFRHYIDTNQIVNPKVPLLPGAVLCRGQGAYAPGTTGANFTWHFTVELPGPFDWFRIVHTNPHNAAYTITHAIFAASANYNDGINPLDESGSAVTWADITYNNCGADSYPGIGSGTQQALTVGPSLSGDLGATCHPTVAYSDWMQCSSFNRVDSGGVNPLLMVRFYVVGTISGRAFLASIGSLANFTAEAAAANLRWEEYHKSGDNVTTPSNFTSPTGPSTFWQAVYGIQIMSRVQGLQVIGIGDSHMQGYRTSSDYLSYLHHACVSLSTPSLPIAYNNNGFQGQTTANFHQNGRDLVDAYQPNVAVIHSMSSNDGVGSLGVMQTGFARAIATIDYCRKRNIIPILVTPFPENTYTAGTVEANRLKIRQYCLNAAASNILVLDVETTGAFDQASPCRVPSAYDSGDAKHMNTAGHKVVGAALAPILAKIATQVRV